MNVPRSSIYVWINQEKFLLEKTNKKESYRLRGGGKIPNTLEIEGPLLKWNCEQLRLNIALSSKEIINKF